MVVSPNSTADLINEGGGLFNVDQIAICIWKVHIPSKKKEVSLR